MAEWRCDILDVIEAAKAFPIPHGFLHGTPFTEAGTHSKDSRRRHQASLKQTGESSSSSSLSQFREVVAPLLERSCAEGREFSPKLLGLVGAREGEHSVIFFPGRVLKLTEPDTAGGVITFTKEGEPKIFFKGLFPITFGNLRPIAIWLTIQLKSKAP